MTALLSMLFPIILGDKIQINVSIMTTKIIVNMGKKLKHIFLLFLCICLSLGVSAQAKFYVKGNNATYTGQTYVITYVLENGKGKNFQIPNTYYLVDIPNIYFQLPQ